jgi:hypothetical protein
MLPPMETAAMVLRILSTWAPLLAASSVAVACSSTKPAAPDAFIEASMGPGPTDPNSVCGLGSQKPWLDIGVATGDNPTRVTDGNQQAGSTVHISCTVATSGSGFDINLNATQEGLQGGSLTITSPGGQGAVTTSGGSGITAVFESGQNGTFRSTSCTISYQYQAGTVPDNPPIAAGRIWAHISCPDSEVSGQTVTAPDGGTQNRTCDGEADILFEQCGS